MAPLADGGAAVSADRPAVIVLSAQNAERLSEQVGRLLAAIESQGLGDHDLVDVAYTLQVGREAMEVRLALTAASMAELEAKLQQYVAGAARIEELYRGEVRRDKEAFSVFAADDDMAGDPRGLGGEGQVRQAPGSVGQGLVVRLVASVRRGASAAAVAADLSVCARALLGAGGACKDVTARG